MTSGVIIGIGTASCNESPLAHKQVMGEESPWAGLRGTGLPFPNCALLLSASFCFKWPQVRKDNGKRTKNYGNLPGGVYVLFLGFLCNQQSEGGEPTNRTYSTKIIYQNLLLSSTCHPDHPHLSEHNKKVLKCILGALSPRSCNCYSNDHCALLTSSLQIFSPQHHLQQDSGRIIVEAVSLGGEVKLLRTSSCCHSLAVQFCISVSTSVQSKFSCQLLKAAERKNNHGGIMQHHSWDPAQAVMWGLHYY